MHSPILGFLQKLHSKYAAVCEGHVADYIPELSTANPNAFGICIATRDGHVYEVGDTRQKFTIQSISKALTYGLALEDRGEDFILSRIGVEPSGEAFNAISLKEGTGAPFNPMINAGAIATCGQVLKTGDQTRIQRITSYLSSCAGQALKVDEAVYQSESQTGHRNRAIGWMLRNFNILDEDPHEILETYFQQCALQVTCADLAVMGATLANQGVNPLTAERAIQQEYVDNVLGVMATCGMYDWSGEWIYRVGLPAKSGVGGGILAVLPGQLGIGVYSPPLDQQGNSVRGIQVCKDIARELALHMLNPSAAPQPAIRLSYNATQVNSRRSLSPTEAQTVRHYGERIRLMELQGPLIFSTFEPVIRRLVQQGAYCQYVILCFGHVISMDAVCLKLLDELRQQLSSEGVRLLFCKPGRFTRALLTAGFEESDIYVNADAALEACEDLLLQEVMPGGRHENCRVNLADCALFRECSPEDLALLEERMPVREYAKGETIITSGSQADEMYVVTSGKVEISVMSEGKKSRKERLNVLSEGMSFGEMSFIDNVPRSAQVLALSPVQCRILDRTLYNELGRERPEMEIKILTQITRLISHHLRQANSEIAALRG